MGISHSHMASADRRGIHRVKYAAPGVAVDEVAQTRTTMALAEFLWAGRTRERHRAWGGRTTPMRRSTYCCQGDSISSPAEHLHLFYLVKEDLVTRDTVP